MGYLRVALTFNHADNDKPFFGRTGILGATEERNKNGLFGVTNPAQHTTSNNDGRPNMVKQKNLVQKLS
jgi:hypothetical protein